LLCNDLFNIHLGSSTLIKGDLINKDVSAFFEKHKLLPHERDDPTKGIIHINRDGMRTREDREVDGNITLARNTFFDRGDFRDNTTPDSSHERFASWRTRRASLGV